MTIGEDGSVSFAAGSTYPRTYDSPLPFIRDDGRTDVCETCTFRPWASSAAAEAAIVTVARADGSAERVAAARLADGRWSAPTALDAGDTATIEPGDLIDTNGETNGAAIVLID